MSAVSLAATVRAEPVEAPAAGSGIRQARRRHAQCRCGRRPLRPRAGLAVRRPDHPAAAGLQHLPAVLDDLAVVHQLPRQPARRRRAVGRHRQLLAGAQRRERSGRTCAPPRISSTCSITLQLLLGFGLALMLNRRFRTPQLLEHRDPAADDAGAGRRRHLLEVFLRAAIRHLQLHRQLLRRARHLHDARRHRACRPGPSCWSTPGCGRPT